MSNNNKSSVLYNYNEYRFCDVRFDDSIEKKYSREYGNSIFAEYNLCTTNVIPYEKDNFFGQKIERLSNSSTYVQSVNISASKVGG